jgi:NAD(P)-dependent dehydrogenase (short-subunit alcohol dehydrogenase family)
MAGKLAGKIAVVTGGSAGIGPAAAIHFAEEGPHVFITGRRRRELDAAAKEISPAATAIKADESFVQSLVPLNRIGLQALLYSLRRRQCYSAV